MSAREVNFDGLVGPTHNYAGLAHGNLAASANRGQRSNPRAAALQGIAKMRALMALGCGQSILPPHERPHIPSLRKMGFSGRDGDVLAAAARAPGLLANASSASAMWTANAATVSPSADCSDGRVHITPANLASHFHRALEVPTTVRVLHRVFADKGLFCVHHPVAFHHFGDEGAANHVRLSASHDAPGVEVFVHGGSAFEATGADAGRRFRARQSLQAAHIVATTHGLDWRKVMIIEQSPEAVDAGAFHNDVVCVGDRALILVHPAAFADQVAVAARLRAVAEAAGVQMKIVAPDLPLADAVASYLFNSQLIALPDGRTALIAPAEVDATPTARGAVAAMVDAGVIDEVHAFDLRESMRNGGGPACLRLRVVLTVGEERALGGCGLLTPSRLDAVEALVSRLYRDRLDPEDLADPALLDESRTFLDELSGLLDLGSVHDFQFA